MTGFSKTPKNSLQAIAHKLARSGLEELMQTEAKVSVVVVVITPKSMLEPDVAISGQLSPEGVAHVLMHLSRNMVIDAAALGKDPSDD